MEENPKTDYTGNSEKSRKVASEPPLEKPKIEKIIEGEAKVKKKGLGAKFKNLIVEADFKGTARYIVYEVMIPAARNTIVDAATRGIERVMYGEHYSSRRGAGTSYSYTPKTQYNRPSGGYGSVIPPRNAPPITVGSRTARNYQDDVILSSKAEAERVLDQLKTVIDQYNFVSVGDYRDMCGLRSDFTDQKWGWVNLIGTEIRSVREGWFIDLPMPEAVE